MPKVGPGHYGVGYDVTGGKTPVGQVRNPYPGQKLDWRGIPVGSKLPDFVTGNRPPTLNQEHQISTSRPEPDYRTGINPPKELKALNALGMNGYTPAANFDLTNNGTAYDSTYTGIQQTNGLQTQNQQSPISTLSISPTGQYTQLSAQSAQTMAAAKKPAPKKKAKNPAYADSEYLAEIRALEKELTDYKAKMALNRTRAGTQHTTSGRDLRQQKDRDLRDLKDDFAARGIVLSGVYGGKVGEYNTLWGQQNSELDRQYKDALTDIQNQYKDYLRQVGVQKEQAKLAAIRRRAQKLGKL